MLSFWLATFATGFFLTPFYIDFLVKIKAGKKIRTEATIWKATLFHKLHKKKSGTPTMWWAIIITTVFLMVLLSLVFQKLGFVNNSLLNQKETYLSLFTLATVWFLWWIDDYMNIKGFWKKKWLSAKFKMAWLLLLAFIWALWFYYKLEWWGRLLVIPGFEGMELWLYFIPLFIFIIVAAANSVNLSDGLDGLCGWLLLFAYIVYAYITYDQGLFLLSTLCVSIAGALISFLWFNVKPAKFYMWDVWSLALGANLWLIAMLTNTVFIFIIVGAIFIAETVSVIIQLTSKKFRNGKKIFKIAPFHHHLEAIGWKEENVVFRLWIIGMLLAVAGIIFYIITKTV